MIDAPIGEWCGQVFDLGSAREGPKPTLRDITGPEQPAGHAASDGPGSNHCYRWRLGVDSQGAPLNRSAQRTRLRLGLPRCGFPVVKLW